jgi:UDP-N-acetylmuramate dehydrogenase
MKLCELTTLRTGGRPARYCRPGGEEELRRALGQCRRARMPWRVLGGGSNLLVGDAPLPFAAIHIHKSGFGDVMQTTPLRLSVGAGLSVAQLLTDCRDAGLGGLEALAGLPGTVGGALHGNAGAMGTQLSDRLTRLWGLDADGRRTDIARSDIAFSYRCSGLHNFVITGAEFELEIASRSGIFAAMRRALKRRNAAHPIGLSTAGCIFRNPAGQSAGRMLDDCGLKGRRIGAAVVSTDHANFIVNEGGARADDVIQLADIMRDAVQRRFGVLLELEVQCWPTSLRAA